MILLNSDSEMNVLMENSPDYISKHYFSKFFQKVRFTFYNYLLHSVHTRDTEQLMIEYFSSCSGNASKITSHIFRIFDSDGNDVLDFKEFLLAIDIANRETGE